MRLGIVSNVVIDEIATEDGNAVWDLGGPPCYCGLTARRFKLQVSLATRVGHDFSDEYVKFFEKSGLELADFRTAESRTTSFKLQYDADGERQLYLKSNCGQVRPRDIDSLKADAWLVSPVYDEVPNQTLSRVKEASKAVDGSVMLDPQGYLRSADSDGRITMASATNLDLAGIDIVKADQTELRILTGGLCGLEGMESLRSKGIGTVLATEHRQVSLLHEETLYWVKIRDINAPDTTGAGDILSSAFICALLKEDDPLWALCFGAGALTAALESGRKGIDKIPEMAKIEQNASYFYNSVGFKKL